MAGESERWHECGIMGREEASRYGMRVKRQRKEASKTGETQT